jgi:hypothetical protein
VIYLQHVWDASGLDAPARIALAADDIEWLRRQVDRELRLLFPDATIEEGGTEASDLAVLAYRRSAWTDAALTEWSRAQAARARTGIALYCVDQRQFEVVARDSIAPWARHRRLVQRAEPIARNHPRGFDRLCALWS